MPLTFSIITCTWNSANYLRESIDSVLSQDYPHIEYIFVDGGSDDGTLDIIRSLKRPYTLLENVRGGVSRAMNEGVRVATGDVIAHLHSDDYYLKPTVLSTVARHLETSGKGWLFGRTEALINGKLHPDNYVSPRFSYSSLLRGNYVPHPATFVRRDLMVRAGCFDTKLKYAMDYDLWLRLARMAEPVQIDEALAAFREHEGSLSSSTQTRLAAMAEDMRVRNAYASKNPIEKLEHYARYFVRRQRAIRAGARG
ncbi:glycosyltransferase family 2 protein [Noviherbaspirillum sp. CPCC 100848]|uniref:Glycosyltransferase family 2 protein n=1 Tax=Noviherbaspirillum album TaxID=3080276 RepID=A0ABU6JEK6_9BURK|nr:glycosyltransferase family 2 protein [Noviherbaspirillum sp. CPCC 100848]MEC4721963.1 glycosyltransferase family 2 protein [Noviherbaspirillum sp. CPCC 100848]